MGDNSNLVGSRNRRQFLTVAGAVLGTSVVPTTASADSNRTTTGDSRSISADMVQPDKPETAREFVKKTLHSNNDEKVREAYRNLSSEQIKAVREAFDYLSRSRIMVDAGNNMNGANVFDTASAAHEVSGSVTYVREADGKTLYTFTCGLTNTIQDGEITGTAVDWEWSGSTYWHYKGLYQGEIIEDSSQKYTYETTGKFKNSVAGVQIDMEYPKVTITRYADGGFSGERELLESV